MRTTIVFLLIAMVCGTDVSNADIDYARIELADEANAWTHWVSALPNLSESEDEAVQQAFRKASDYKHPLPTGAPAQRLAEWLHSKTAYLEQLDAGIALGKLQLPPIHPDDWTHGKLARFRYGSHCKIIKARMLAHAGHYDAAAAELSAVYRMGHMIVHGDGTLIHYLIGWSIQSAALRGMRDLADQPRVPVRALLSAGFSIRSEPAEDDALAQSYRVEFSLFLLPKLEAMIAEETYSVISPITDPKLEPKVTVRPFPVDVAGILDLEATMRTWRDVFARRITNARLPWTDRDTRITEDTQKALVLPSDTGDDLVWDAARFDIDNPEHWEQLEEMARVIPNLYGKHMISREQLGHDLLHERSVKFRTEANLTKTYLAIRYYQMMTGRLPDNLSVLVEAEILDAIPVDLFTGKPINYASETGKIWSADPNGALPQSEDGGAIIYELPEVRRQ